MLDYQFTLDVSPYSSLYDIVVPKTHFLRQMANSVISALFTMNWKRITGSILVVKSIRLS